MRQWIVIAAVLASLLGPRSLEARGAKRYLVKESTMDTLEMNRIFLGWVDMGPTDWAKHGYGSEQEWTDVINRLNKAFQEICQSRQLAGRTVTGAKNKNDQNPAGNDLYVKFSDVSIDYNRYHLNLSIHFIDPKTNTELASVPLRPYYGNSWGFERYLQAALTEVAVKLRVEIIGSPLKKK